MRFCGPRKDHKLKFIIKNVMVGLAMSVFASVFTLNAAHATERVQVSVAPLHSLVSYLLKGVDRPGLLFERQDNRVATVPSDQERQKIDAAKMVVWVGAEYETSLAGLRTIQPAQSLKGLTLSSTVPLLGLPDADQPERSEGKFVMDFWLDPRLAKVAASRIAPQLVRLYPDQAEQILDNEVQLKQQLMELEHHFRHVLGQEVGVPLHVPQSDILYLAWRFNLAVPNCAGGAKVLRSFAGKPGETYYFNMMDSVLKELKSCQRET